MGHASSTTGGVAINQPNSNTTDSVAPNQPNSNNTDGLAVNQPSLSTTDGLAVDQPNLGTTVQDELNQSRSKVLQHWNDRYLSDDVIESGIKAEHMEYLLSSACWLLTTIMTSMSADQRSLLCADEWVYNFILHCRRTALGRASNPQLSYIDWRETESGLNAQYDFTWRFIFSEDDCVGDSSSSFDISNHPDNLVDGMERVINKRSNDNEELVLHAGAIHDMAHGRGVDELKKKLADWALDELSGLPETSGDRLGDQPQVGSSNAGNSGSQIRESKGKKRQRSPDVVAAAASTPAASVPAASVLVASTTMVSAPVSETQATFSCKSVQELKDICKTDKARHKGYSKMKKEALVASICRAKGIQYAKP